MHELFFRITARDTKTRARTGILTTPHGDIQTPAFIPVGTQASIKSLDSTDIRAVGVEMFFVNTYHMYLRPGTDIVKHAGGLHAFMSWDGPIITDSGGFQAFSLSRMKFSDTTSHAENPKSSVLSRVTDDGIEFQSHWDGSRHTFTAEKSMELQWALQSDIHIAFDDCTPYPISHTRAHASMERTHRWAHESLEAHRHLKARTRHTHPQYLYGVVQGSVYEDLRIESSKTISGMGFDGIAIGGVSVGESKEDMKRVLIWTVPFLPEEMPRHLLGVGEIDDVFALVSEGIDTFDCVQPTRLARMGHILCMSQSKSQGSTSVRYSFDVTKKEYAQDYSPLEPGCGCMVCRTYSRAYIHHLFRVKELVGYRLATMHNVSFMMRLVRDIRNAIEAGTALDTVRRRWIG